MDKSIKQELIILCCLLVVGGLLAGCIWIQSTVHKRDNPVSLKLAEFSAARYLRSQYPDSGYEISSAAFKEKEGGKYEYYCVHISAPQGVDGSFELRYNAFGKLQQDTYQDSVVRRGSTASRLSEEYQTAVSSALSSMPMDDCEEFSCSAGLRSKLRGEPPNDVEGYMIRDELELNGIYPVAETGAKAGWLRISAKVECCDPEKMAQLLLRIRKTLDQAEVPFRTVALTLWSDSGSRYQKLALSQFPYSAIYEEGLAIRVMSYT